MEWFAAHQRRRRVIISSDVKNEADDQYAIVHALLSPSLDVRGVIPAHFGTWRGPNSMAESRAETDLLLELIGMAGQIPVADGAPVALRSETDAETSCPGADLIITEAWRVTDDAEDPLFIAVLGPLTDVAVALLRRPELAQRNVIVVWIGGEAVGATPTYFPEFNLGNDIHAANVVFDSGIQVWQIPVQVFGQFVATYAELQARVAPCGELGAYLFRQLVEFNASQPVRMELRVLGDQPAITAIMAPDAAPYQLVAAPRFGVDGAYRPSNDPHRHTIRQLTAVDTRFTFEDLFHKLAAWAAEQEA